MKRLRERSSVADQPAAKKRMSHVEALPRWRQLWEERGGGMAVDYEELLWGWFPFIEEDFSLEGDDGWLCIWVQEDTREMSDRFFEREE